MLPEPDGADAAGAVSDVERGLPVPVPPFWGERVVKGVQLADYASYLDERATFVGQWGLRGARSGQGPTYEELVETEGRPRLRMWLERVQTEGLLEAAVVYGYYPCVSEGNDLVVLHREGDGTQGTPGSERVRFTFPRQRRDRRLCLADFFRSREEADRLGGPDVVAFQLVTMGPRVSTGDRRALREERLPRLPRAARALGPAHRGARRGLARPGPRPTWASAPRTTPTSPASCARATAGRATRSATRPARTSRTGPRSSRCCEPERIGVELSEELQLHPEQSTDALVVHHPEAKYFNAT